MRHFKRLGFLFLFLLLSCTIPPKITIKEIKMPNNQYHIAMEAFLNFYSTTDTTRIFHEKAATICKDYKVASFDSKLEGNLIIVNGIITCTQEKGK